MTGVEAMLWHLSDLSVLGRLSKVRVDKGVVCRSAERLSRGHGIEVERHGWTTHPKPPAGAW